MNLRALTLLVVGGIAVTPASAYNFSVSTLHGVTLASATSLQFGPDNRLYVAQVNGQILALTIQRVEANNYQVTATETINLVRDIPNYNDDGTRNLTLTTRQSTGLLVVGTPTNPILYVSSSDPRIGGGSGGENDLNLDTNSGIISRLTKTGSTWTKVDIVRGLPRSEENHATNGMQLDAATNRLYVAQGGNTNAGGPSIGFAFLCETALSAAILSVDLNAITALPVKIDAYGQSYLYDLPTLNDPDLARAHNPDGSDVNDPFGGNDGLNQARLVSGGPVQVYSSGFRNPYDVLFTRTPGMEGRLYAFDNGPNQGWGGYPHNEGATGSVTNQYVDGEPGTVNNKDNLHLITGPGFYGGHPNPIRANPAGAGWFHFDNSQPVGSERIYSTLPTSDWPPVSLSMANPVEGDYRQPGVSDFALMTYPASTNGLAEYVAGNFSGEMQGNLIAATYDGKLLRIALNASGTVVTNGVEPLASGFGNLPLDVATPDPAHGTPFVGTIWVAHYIPAKISVLEPADFDSPGGPNCTGANSFSIDEDFDGYSNADEIANNSDPCSAAIRPPDADGDLLSDLTDTDDDNDGIADAQDPFPIGPLNGHSVPLPVHYELFNDTGIGFFGVGFTGVMMNSGEDYLQRLSADNVIAGGTAGLFTLAQAGSGTARGSSNNQNDAYQFAFNSDEFTTPFVISSRLAGPFFAGAPTANQTQGIYLGTGDQNDYLSVALHANGGAGGIEVVREQAGIVISQMVYPISGFEDLSTADLYLTVDPPAATVLPGYQLSGSSNVIALGDPIPVGGDLLTAIMGQKPLAIGLFANTGEGAAPTFAATWDFFSVQPILSTAFAKLTVDPTTSDMATSSTYTAGGFQLQNLSSGGEHIESVTINLSTAIFPDVVFDTTGTAGDPDFKDFDPNSASSGVSVNTGVATHPHNGINSQDGFDQLDIDFNSFPSGGSFTFSIDIDPTSVKGVAAPGQNHSASVSGLELIGSTVSIYFSDGGVHRTRLGRVENSLDGSYGWLRSDKPPKPGISVVGKSSPFVTGQSEVVRVTGPVGFTASLVTVEGALYIGGVPGGGYDLDPYEANTAIKVTETSALIPGSGEVSFLVTPTKTNSSAGYNYLTATLSNDTGIKGAVSDSVTIQFNPDLSGGDTQAPTAPGNLETQGTTTRSVTLHWTASTDNVGVTSYDILRNGAVVTTTPGLTYTDIGLEPGTAVSYLVRARDAAGNLSPSASVSTTTAAGGTVVLRVNAGGPTFVDSFGKTWTADNGFNTGNTASTTFAIDRTVDDTLFKTERWDPATSPVLTYSFALTNGQYEVQLFLAETHTASSGPGLRVFDVAIENTLAFDNLDIFAQAGGPATALVVSANTTVNDGQLNISFLHGLQNPKVCAIRVIRLPAAETTPPTTPGNFTANNITSSSANLQWTASTDNVGVTGYIVSRNSVAVATVTQLSFSDTGLQPATTYQFEVRATDAAGNVSPPAALSVTTVGSADTVPPTAPGSLAFTNVTATSLTVSWAAATDNIGVTGYRVSRNGVLQNTVTGLTFNDTGLSPDTAYGYSVVAVDAAGNTSSASTASQTTAQAGTTTALVRVNSGGPSYIDSLGNTWSADFGYNTGKVSTSSATITGTADPTLYRTERWDEPSGNELLYSFAAPNGTYQVRLHFAETYSGGKGVGLRVFDIDLQAVRTFEDVDIFSLAGGADKATTLQAPVTVTDGIIRIRFLHQLQNPKINAIEILSSTAPTDTQPPTTPTNLAANLLTSTSLTLNWSASSDNVGVTGYALTRDGAPLTTVTATSFADSNLTPATSYTYTVVARDGAGNTSSPASLSVSTSAASDTQPPTTPANLAASDVTSSNVTLTWNASTDNMGVTGYRVSRNGLLRDTVTGTTFSDAVSPATTYAYEVRAIDAANNASSPADLSVTTPPLQGGTPPTAPTNLTASAVTTNSLNLSWTASTDDLAVVDYDIFRGETLAGTVTATGFSDTGLSANTIYTYTVVANDADGGSTSSAPFTVVTESTTMIRLNAGDSAYTDSMGHLWEADRGFNTGKVATTTAVVSGTHAPSLFLKERWDELAGNELLYTLSIPNGTYLVRLFFAETHGPAKGAGLRVFDIDLQTVRTFEDVDIFTLAGGGNTALVLEATATVTAGTIRIRFLHQVQNPKINAIEIRPVPLVD